MRAYLIDPEARTFDPVEHDGSLASIYRHTQCDCVDAVRLAIPGAPPVAIYVDDEGLCKDGLALFHIAGSGTYAGRGLLVGTNHKHGDGEVSDGVWLWVTQRLGWPSRPDGQAIRTGEPGAPEAGFTVTAWPEA